MELTVLFNFCSASFPPPPPQDTELLSSNNSPFLLSDAETDKTAPVWSLHEHCCHTIGKNVIHDFTVCMAYQDKGMLLIIKISPCDL